MLVQKGQTVSCDWLSKKGRWYLLWHFFWRQPEAYQPKSFLHRETKDFGPRPLVKMLASCSLVSTLMILRWLGSRWLQNQLYFTAKCFNFGVMRGSGEFAKASAPTLSSCTVVLIVALCFKTEQDVSRIPWQGFRKKANHAWQWIAQYILPWLC